MTASRLEIHLFGALEVRIEGIASPPIPLRKARWLLALLALRAGRTVDRDWLAALLWPDHDESTARRNPRPCLSNDLRPYLRAASACLVAPTFHTLLLEVEGVWVDVLAFDAALANGSKEALERGVALYRGPVLEECLEEWVLPERRDREQA